MKCFVPGCPNRSQNTTKLFFSIPKNPAVKDVWYKTVGYSNECVRKVSPLCCEDHFDLPEDMENYMRYRFMGGQKKLRKGILPRFNLLKGPQINQNERRNIIETELNLPETNILYEMIENIGIKTESELPENQNLCESNILIQQIDDNVPIKTEIMSQMNNCVIIKTESLISDMNLNLSTENILNEINESFVIKTESELPDSNTFNQIDLSPESFLVKMESNVPVTELDLFNIKEERLDYNPDHQTDSNNLSIKPNELQNVYEPIYYCNNLNQANELNRLTYSCNNDQETEKRNCSKPLVNQDLLLSIDHDHKHLFTSCYTQEKKIDRSIQTNLKPYFRSKAIMCNYKPLTKDAATSTISFQKKKKSSKLEVKKPKASETDEEWKSKVSESERKEIRVEILKSGIFESSTKVFIENDPLLFLGVPKDSMHVIENIQSTLNIPIGHIYCVLKKIRLNLSNEVLSYDFGLSYSQISQIFKKTVPLIANFLKNQIFWQNRKEFSENLPIQFRKRLKNVQSILNIFEIKMERSSLIQGLRLPSYESTNTARFLVSSTPKGFINFISTRYSKRNSDTSIVETSGFLDVLPEGVVVLTLVDCGFKYVDAILKRQNCQLIRLPSFSLKKNWKAQSKFTRWLASVRVHVKRLMNQLKDFKILENTFNLGKRSESLLDDIVIIAAALNNMQLSTKNEEDSA